MGEKYKCHLLEFGMAIGFLVAGRMAGAATPDPFICMFGHSDNVGVTEHFRTFIPPFTVIEGTGTDPDFIKELRADGKIYAAHVTNPTGDSAAQLVARWRIPFDNTLGGQLPGGYDAISIDELHGAHTNGTAHSNAVTSALADLRVLYPTKQIYVAVTWHYSGGPASYTDQLNAVNTYADMLMAECYIRESNPSYGWLTQWADNLKNTIPGILNKTVFGLYTSQGGFVADDTTSLGYWGHLDEQFHRIKNDADASDMPGVMLWPYYRSEQTLTPDYCTMLINHYYTDGQTVYFGDGSASQLISNSQFENTTSGWTLTPGSGGSIDLFNYGSVSVANDHDDFGLASHGSYGLRMIRGSNTNAASTQISGLSTAKAYTVSAWVISLSGSTNTAKVAITETDGTPIQSKTLTNVGTPPNFITTWNEWSRIIFHFVPTVSTINIILSDEGASAGQTLNWDFIELEDAFDAITAFDLGAFDGNGLVNCNDLQVLKTPGDPSADIASQPNADNEVNLFGFSLFSFNYLSDDPFSQQELDNFTTFMDTS